MNLLDLFEAQQHPAYANLDALQQAVKSNRDAVINFGGEPTKVEYPLARYVLGRYQAQQTGADRGRFLAALADAQKFDMIAKEYRDAADRAQLENIEKDTGWHPAQKVHKDQYGNVIKHMAKHLAKQGLKQTQTNQELKKKPEVAKESLRQGEWHDVKVTFDDGSTTTVKTTGDSGYRDQITQHFARQGKTVKDIEIDWAVKSVNEAEKKPKPTNPQLWGRAKAAAKSKFDVYPSAYANAWAAKWYKQHGGGWR